MPASIWTALWPWLTRSSLLRHQNVYLAAVYFFFALSQLILLAALKPAVLDAWSASLAAVGVAVYALLGNFVFRWSSNQLYQT